MLREYSKVISSTGFIVPIGGSNSDKSSSPSQLAPRGQLAIMGTPGLPNIGNLISAKHFPSPRHIPKHQRGSQRSSSSDLSSVLSSLAICTPLLEGTPSAPAAPKKTPFSLLS